MLEFRAEPHPLRAAALFAVPDRASAAMSSKSPIMILLHAPCSQLPLNENVYRNKLACQGRPRLHRQATDVESVEYEQYSPSLGRTSNPFRMTTFANSRMQLLCNDNVYKKPGVGVCLRSYPARNESRHRCAIFTR